MSQLSLLPVRLVDEIPAEWYRIGGILKSKPGRCYAENLPETGRGATRLSAVHPASSPSK